MVLSPRSRKSPLRKPESQLSLVEKNCPHCSPGKRSPSSSPRRVLTRVPTFSPSRNSQKPRSSPSKKTQKENECNKNNNIEVQKINKNEPLKDLNDALKELNEENVKKTQEPNSKRSLDFKNHPNSPRKSPRKSMSSISNDKKPATSSYKYFPIFDPSKRLADKKKSSLDSLPKTRYA